MARKKPKGEMGRRKEEDRNKMGVDGRFNRETDGARAKDWRNFNRKIK